jgi:hypothetical protein
MTVADRILALLEHRRVDPESDQLLEALIGGLAVAFDRAGLVAYGDETIPAGAALTDPGVAPLWALPHAALYTGGTLPPRLPDETDPDYLARARADVVFPRGMRRGSHAAVRTAAEPHLTGSKTVVIVDDQGGPYDLTVRTRTSETPDPAAARRAIEGSHVSGGPVGAIRAELVLNHIVSDDVIWDEVRDDLTWDEIDPALTWDDVTAADVT